MTTQDQRSSAKGYALLVLSALVIALVGFSVFRDYLVQRSAGFEGVSLLLLAMTAGVASFFSPCSFPLLLTLLARETGSDSEAPAASTGRALQFATSLSIGVTAFLLLAGFAVAAGAGPLFRQITFTSPAGRWLRGIVGLALILLGLLQTETVPIRFDRVAAFVRPLMRTQAGLRRQRPTLAFGLFGFSYILAGFG